MQVTLTLPPEVVTRLDEVEEEERSRAKIVEIAVREWLAQRRDAAN